jgi:[glutamine synthetase] adenylyltransferase / [glutamine synthetase]-adenylyl-L-tyrosine phosphorylase
VTDAHGRASTVAARLARLGFADVGQAEARLSGGPPLGPVGSDPRFQEAVGSAADPHLALTGLERLVLAAQDDRGADGAAGGPGDLLALLAADPGLRGRLLSVLGSSVALGEHLVRHPAHWSTLATGDQAATARPTEEAVRHELVEAVAGRSGDDALDALRVAYRRHLLALAARDLSGAVPLDDVAGELADLAGATLEAALAVARSELPSDHEPCRLCVIALGKCGGRELNYVSDVDVVFVAEPVDGGDEKAALATATRLAGAVMRACSASTAEGTIWPVDANLRPEGRAGALVRTLASHLAYYERWAQTWEFQALLKARPVAGDLDLGDDYVQALAPLVWNAAQRPGFVDDARAMRRRVVDAIPAREAARELKLGPGGLRDVEFSVQLLQLVHGRTDIFVRSPTTLVALEQLSTLGYVGRGDAAELDHAYRFLRTLEHRIQLYRLRRTHLVPSDPAELRRIARSMGYRVDPAEELVAEWGRHAREVRRLHEKLFYRPLLNAVARLEPGQVRLTREAATARLEALGYQDTDSALRNLEALTSGVSRRAAIQRTLLPVLLGWFAESPDPDAGLLGFRQVSDALGTTHWYLGLLRDAGAAAERLARVLGSSRYATDLLLRAPEAVALLADDNELAPRPDGTLAGEMRVATTRHDDPSDAVRTLRALRRRELFRTSVADVLDLVDVDQVGRALTAITSATLGAALDAAVRAVEADTERPLATRLAVIGMGRLGGTEMGYGSDADVLFVHDPVDEADERTATDDAHAAFGELRRLLAIPGPDPRLVVDADLRPEGRQGPLVRTLASFEAYYERWAQIWESQALLRARPVAGDPDLGTDFVRLVDPLRYPQRGLTDADLREIRRIKARVEAERMPRGQDPALNTKLGRGGLADVEWTVQLLQLRYAAEVPGLRTTRTLDALEAALVAGLVEADAAEILAEAWTLASRVRGAVVLVRGKNSDTLPRDTRELAAVGRVLGYAPGQTGELVEDYRRATRRARTVVEKVFYA